MLAVERPEHGRAGDLVLQTQLPWQSGRIAVLAGRIAIAITGVVVPMLVVTGMSIRDRERRARASSRSRRS